MPYKDPIKAALQKQRWAELHPEYMKAKQAEIEKRNQRWKSKRRQDYMKKWRAKNKKRMKWYADRNRFLHAADLPKWKHADYLRRKEYILKKSHEDYIKNKSAILAKQKQYRQAHRTEYNAFWRKRRATNIELFRLRSRVSALKSYYKNVDLNRAKAVAKEAAKRVLIAQRRDTSEDVDLFIWKLKTDPSATCSYCGKSIPGEVHIDHILALSRGGSHTINNLCGACQDCNFSKGSKTLSEWEEFKRFVISKGQNAIVP